MSRAWQAERAAEREIASLDRDLDEGRISASEHRAAVREIERDLRACYEDDLLDAQERVRDEWGF